MAARRRDSLAYYTIAQAAEVLGLCPDTVYRMAADGRLMCAHFGRAIRIPRRAVDPPDMPAPAASPAGVAVGGFPRSDVA